MQDQAETKTTKIHFFYVTLILGLFILLLITRHWTAIPGFMDYLNVGATVTSLVLGVLAIIYSFTSSAQQSTLLGAVQAAAASTQASVAKLDGFMSSAENLQADAAKRTMELHSLTESLASSVDGIREETKSLLAANQEIAGKVDALPVQIGQLKGIIEKSDKASAPQLSGGRSKLIELSPEDIDNSLNICSMFGLSTIEALIKSRELGKAVSLTKLDEALKGGGQDYFWGFIVGFAATRLVQIKTTEAGSTDLRLIGSHPLLKERLEAQWVRREEHLSSPEGKMNLARCRDLAVSALIDLPPSGAAEVKNDETTS